MTAEEMIKTWCAFKPFAGVLTSPMGVMRYNKAGVLEFTISPGVRIRPEGSWCRLCPAFCLSFADPTFARKRAPKAVTDTTKPRDVMPLLEEFFDAVKLSSVEALRPLQLTYRQEAEKRQNEGCTQCEMGALRAQFTRQALLLLQPPLATPETRPT